MKLVVTGSSGYLGRPLCQKLRSLGHHVIGIDLIANNDTTTMVGDICDRTFISGCFSRQQIDAIFHTATLHKPHISSHTNQEFIDVNVTGTLNLLEESVKAGIQKFIFTSTTSTFGLALAPSKFEATWITEEVTPIPKNIYGVTKFAAENLCQLFHQNHKLSVIVLRTSRFFPEEDDDAKIASQYDSFNAKANELLYRRVDLRDVVDAHLIALEKVKQIGFNTFIISSNSPFTQEDRFLLRTNPAVVVSKYFPTHEEEYKKLNWKMFHEIDRIYITDKAEKILGFSPKYNFEYHLNNGFKELFNIPSRDFPYHELKKEVR